MLGISRRPLTALVATLAAATAHAQPSAADWSALARLPDLSGVWVPDGSIEMSSPGVLTRSGWSKRTFNAGDKITLKLGPLRNGDRGGIFLEATLADGRVMTYSTELPTE